jgi:hypothetical protein
VSVFYNQKLWGLDRMQIVFRQPEKQQKEHQANGNDLFCLCSLGLWEAMSSLINLTSIKGSDMQGVNSLFTHPFPFLKTAHQNCFILKVLTLQELPCPNIS